MMPAKKDSKAYNKHHSFLGQFQVNKKTMSKNEEKLNELKNNIVKQNLEIETLNKQIHSNEMLISRKKQRIQDLKKENDSLPKEMVVKPSVILSKTRKRRLSNPSSETLKRCSKTIRRTETFLVAGAIHGATKQNKDP